MKTVELDFTKPAEARKFLREFRLNTGEPLLWVETSDGKQTLIDECTDRQACTFATQVYEDFYEKGLGYCEEVTTH